MVTLVVSEEVNPKVNLILSLCPKNGKTPQKELTFSDEAFFQRNTPLFEIIVAKRGGFPTRNVSGLKYHRLLFKRKKKV